MAFRLKSKDILHLQQLQRFWKACLWLVNQTSEGCHFVWILAIHVRQTWRVFCWKIRSKEHTLSKRMEISSRGKCYCESGCCLQVRLFWSINNQLSIWMTNNFRAPLWPENSANDSNQDFWFVFLLFLWKCIECWCHFWLNWIIDKFLKVWILKGWLSKIPHLQFYR